MMHSIQWHKTCFLNTAKFVEEERRRLRALRENLDRLEQDLHFYQYQIEEAERVGRRGFDSERFRKGGEK